MAPVGACARGGTRSNIQWVLKSGGGLRAASNGHKSSEQATSNTHQVKAGGGASGPGSGRAGVYAGAVLGEQGGVGWRVLSRRWKGLSGLHPLESGTPRFPSSSVGRLLSGNNLGSFQLRHVRTPGSSPHLHKVLKSRPAASGLNPKRTLAGGSGLRSF